MFTALMNLITRRITPTATEFSGPSAHFTWREVACRDRERTLPTGKALENARKAAVMMEAIRDAMGDNPITVNSWYRTPAYNMQVKGASDSRHMLGMAVDFTVQSMAPEEVFMRLRVLRDAGQIGIGGLAGYKNFVHADIGEKRNWKTGMSYNDDIVRERKA